MSSPVRSTLAILAFAIACSSKHTRTTYVVVSPPRDWAAHPAIVQIDAPGPIYALSDVHGGYDRMIALLAAHGVIAEPPPSPDAIRWSAHDAILVVAGDLMDKGPSALEALAAVRALEPQAEAAGGRVVFTMGNHEAEFFDDPENDKATKSDGVDAEIHAHGLDPIAIASGRDPLGAWLRDRPFAVRVRGWFFSHAGHTRARSVAELERAIRDGITTNDYDDAEAIGASSILEARDWYDTGGDDARALGVAHLVFGHTPDALGARGEIAVAQGGLLFRIDCGLSPDVNDSDGRMLRIRTDDAGVETAESLDARGTVRVLWNGTKN